MYFSSVSDDCLTMSLRICSSEIVCLQMLNYNKIPTITTEMKCHRKLVVVWNQAAIFEIYWPGLDCSWWCQTGAPKGVSTFKAHNLKLLTHAIAPHICWSPLRSNSEVSNSANSSLAKYRWSRSNLCYKIWTGPNNILKVHSNSHMHGMVGDFSPTLLVKAI